jgi:hypothetical protein
MEAVRRKRTWQLWQTTVENRVGILSRLVQEHHATLPLNTILPGIGDLYTQDAFRAVLDCPLNEDDSDPVTADGFHPAMATLPTFAQQWRLAATEIVRNLLPPLEEATREVDEKLSAETLVHTPTPPDRLQLATSVFECVCSWRRCYRTYPNVLAHRCSNSFGGTSVDSDSDEDLGTEDIPAGFDLMAAPWSRDNLRKWFVKITGHVSFNGKNKLRFDHFTRGSLFLHARAIIFVRMAGLDPDTATQADMDASGARFICSCDNGTEECGGEQSVMDWRNLVCVSPTTSTRVRYADQRNAFRSSNTTVVRPEGSSLHPRRSPKRPATQRSACTAYHSQRKRAAPATMPPHLIPDMDPGRVRIAAPQG